MAGCSCSLTRFGGWSVWKSAWLLLDPVHRTLIGQGSRFSSSFLQWFWCHHLKNIYVINWVRILSDWKRSDLGAFRNVIKFANEPTRLQLYTCQWSKGWVYDLLQMTVQNESTPFVDFCAYFKNLKQIANDGFWAVLLDLDFNSKLKCSYF